MRCSILCFILFVAAFPSVFASIEVENDSFIEYVHVTPLVQVPFQNISIIAIIRRPTEEFTISLIVQGPNGLSLEYPMEYNSKGMYKVNISMGHYGSYECYILILTKYNMQYVSSSYPFVVSPSTTDQDNDGMPDWWEKTYGLSISSKKDAYLDVDDDGFTNIEEYLYDMNPLENNFYEIALHRLKQNCVYLSFSLFIFFLLIFFSLMGIRRNIQWH